MRFGTEAKAIRLYSYIICLAQIMIPQTDTPYSLFFQPNKDALLDKYLGKSLDTLRTPAMIIDRRLFAQNCSSMHRKAREYGASFRAHLKTHKVGSVSYSHRNLH